MLLLLLVCSATWSIVWKIVFVIFGTLVVRRILFLLRAILFLVVLIFFCIFAKYCFLIESCFEFLLVLRFFLVLTEESYDEFIFHSEEEEDFEGYAELYEDELSVSRKGSINFWWLPIICREGYFFAIWSILLFVAVSCCFTKLLLLLLEFLWWVFILLSVLSNFFEQYRLRILNRDRENSESDELLSLKVLLVIGFRTVTIFVGIAMY